MEYMELSGARRAVDDARLHVEYMEGLKQAHNLQSPFAL